MTAYTPEEEEVSPFNYAFITGVSAGGKCGGVDKLVH